MKILLCKSHLAGPVSGADETLIAYATHLHKEGHRLAVVLLYPPANADQYYARLKQAGIEVITITSYPLIHIILRNIKTLIFYCAGFLHLPGKPLRHGRQIWQRISQWVSLLYLKSCRSYFERCQAALIHVLTPDPGAAVMIRAGFAADVPVFYQELGTPHYLPELDIHYEWFAKVLPLCSEVAALSPRLAQQWGEKFLSANPISVLPLLVEDTHTARPAQSKLPADVTFGFAGRMERGKGPMILLEAFAQVRPKLANISLKLAGAGPQQQAVKARAKTLGVLDACAFLDPYNAPEAKSAFMYGLDVFVLPTLAEGTPNSIIEAMAHGLPVIASAVGGIPDLITPETGILVPPGDPQALADAMLLLASDPELRARMGHAARASYEKLFSPQVVLPTLVSAYQRLARNNGHASAAPPTPRLAHPWRSAAPAQTNVAPLDRTVAPRLRGQRIIFVFGSLDLGGAERQALILAKHLAAQEQAQVEVWGFNHAGPVATLCEQYGLAWRVVPDPLAGGHLSRPLRLAKFAWRLRRAQPDMLLPYTLIPNVACGLVWQWTGARACVWNQRDEGIARLSRRVERWAVQRTPQFISNSPQGARFLLSELKVHPAKVSVIANGVEGCAPQMNRLQWRAALQLEAGCFVACMIANLHKHKDHETLLRAWRRVATTLAASGRDAVLLLAGRYDDTYEALIALSYQLEINHNVRFLGHVSDLPGLLSAVDISVFSSRSEGCPNGVLESMGAGLAVAGTDIEGLRETVGPAGLPFLAPPGAAEALAEIILKLANDPTLCSNLGAEHQNRIRNKYHPTRMCEETVSLLTNPLHEKTATLESGRIVNDAKKDEPKSA
jgi:glycosyltransferase involved in cell wall biosynthesis